MMKDDRKWQAVINHDAASDGKFWYGVRTTGVYCRPSCPARRGRRANVRFYDSSEAAEKDGLRPCKRCKPDQLFRTATLDVVVDACRYIERNPEATQDLNALAKRAGVSPFQLHRAFKAFLRNTPARYAAQLRIERLKKHLRRQGSVTRAIYDAGFESSSAVYGRLDVYLGMSPKRYKNEGAGVFIAFAFARTALGRVLIGATSRGICYLQIGDSDLELIEQLAEEYPKATISPSINLGDEQFDAWVEALSAFLHGNLPAADLPLDIRGTAFQMQVWDFLRSIPPGEVRAYSDVARAVGKPKAARAVAGACARNRIAVLIPCHRVVCGGGESGGYRWGAERKKALLAAERNKVRRALPAE